MPQPGYQSFIDYAASKHTIYTNMMKVLLEAQYRSLLWLDSPDHPITSEELPSWVPDWTTDQSIYARSLLWWPEKSRCFDAAKGKKSEKFEMRENVLDFDGDILTLSGVSIGFVTCVATSELGFHNFENS
jgi:hypothetical protein